MSMVALLSNFSPKQILELDFSQSYKDEIQSCLDQRCYVRLMVSDCTCLFEGNEYSFSLYQNVNRVIDKAMVFASKKELAWGQESSKICVWNVSTHESSKDVLCYDPIEGHRPLSHYYKQDSCATILIHIEDSYTRAVLSMG